MTNIITVGIQKGGVGKSTVTGMFAYMLSQDNQKVLVIDLDGQSNLTSLMTGLDNLNIIENTIYDSLTNNKPTSECIIQINENLDLISGDNRINTLAKNLYEDLDGDYKDILLNALEDVISDYDYILIDTQPTLSELMILALCSSNEVIIVTEPTNFGYISLKSYLETVLSVKNNINDKLIIKGIIKNSVETRRSDHNFYSKLINKMYGDICCKNFIKRKAIIGRVSAFGITGNKEITKVMKEFKLLYRELFING